MHDPVLEPIQRMPLIEEMTGRLRELIDSGRPTTREALRTLEALGLIELRTGRGAFVQAKDSPADEEFPFADWPRSYRWRIADVLEARVAIVQAAVALATHRRRDEELTKMRTALNAFEAAAASGDLSALVLADVEFHEAIVEGANPVLASLLKSIRRSRTRSLPRRERRETAHGRCETVYDAIAEGDAEQAAERMESHLLEFARELGVKASATIAPEKAR